MKFILRNANIINEEKSYYSDILLSDSIIERIDNHISINSNYSEFNCEEMYVLPGLIDDHVHFRDPGLTQKGDIFSESMAAVAGGITSFMDMPNTIPQTTTIDLLEKKYLLAQNRSFSNYSFYIGATNSNLEELKRINKSMVPGVKVFMGSSTGNMLVNEEESLENIFSQLDLPIAIHSEDENIIQKNITNIKSKYGDNPPHLVHPLIRSAEACFYCTKKAVDLALKFNTKLHILHLTTALEVNLLYLLKQNNVKNITSEVCTQHLWFADSDYEEKQQYIKWNPAIKSKEDRSALRKALVDGIIDVVASDHAPHTFEEKSNSYFYCPSGGPMVQHSLLALLQMVKEGVFKLVEIPKFTAHAPALLFGVERRGFIREGYFGDIVVVNPNKNTLVANENVFYKCKWTPFNKFIFNSKIMLTFVNSNLVYQEGNIFDVPKGVKMVFNG